MSRSPSSDDSLFTAAMRDVKPLRRKKRRAVVAAKPARRATKPEPVALPAAPRPAAARPVVKPDSRANPGLDRRTEERLQRGRLPIDRRLDLHGMTEEAAHAALTRAIREAWRAGLRVLLVITGKGRDGEGKLRRNLPRWIATDENANRVLRLKAARPQHGGDGAFYLLLRRNRGDRP